MDRALNSDAGKHFHFFLFKLFSFDFCFLVFFTTSSCQLYVMPVAVSRYFYGC